MSDDVRYCSYRWRASRIELESVPVEHVCAEVMDHPPPHVCSCNATLEELPAE